MFYTAWKMRLSAADCLFILGFWGLHPKSLKGLSLDPTGGRKSPDSPANPTSNPWLRYSAKGFFSDMRCILTYLLDKSRLPES